MSKDKRKSGAPRTRPRAVRADDEEFDPAPREQSGEDDIWEEALSAPAAAPPAAAAPVPARAAPARAAPAAAPLVHRQLRAEQPPPRVVSLDKRKLTKKQTSELAAKWHGDNHGAAVDTYFRGMFEEARKESGHRGCYMGADTKKLLIGIPMYGGHGLEAEVHLGCLPMEFVIAQDVFPLGVVIQIVAPYGVGKCLGRGTPVLLASGATKPVEAVVVGDRLLGPDGGPRVVCATTRGRDTLYRVAPIKGEPWVCNSAHMLTVVNSTTDRVVDITVEDWFKRSTYFRQYHKLFSVGVDRFEAAAPPVLPVDPYFLGVWFGDGGKSSRCNVAGKASLAKVIVTKPDPEIRAVCESIAAQWGLRVRAEKNDMTYNLVSDVPGGFQRSRVNRLLEVMRELVGARVEIPQAYLRAERADRLQFLAGFLDTDAELANNCFVLTQKREDWARAVWWLARSVGLCSTITTRQGRCGRADGSVHTGTYHVVTISGNVDEIPLRVIRKQATVRRQRKVATRTGFKVTKIGKGAYYGFTVDGDQRFLLGDFTVTHNSTLLAEFARWFDLAGGGSEINENETKFSPELYESILGARAFARMFLHRCNSVEDWQRSTTKIVARHKRYMKGTAKEPGPGRTLPIMVGTDSIMGKMSEEVQESILGSPLESDPDQRGKTGKGAASRSFPIEAQIISKYMRTIPQELDGWPFAIVLVNHLRLNKDDTGNTVRSKGGGEQVNFQESFELEIKKVGGHKRRIEGLAFEGYPVEISCEKSSFGPTHRRIQTRVLWWEEENADGEWYQRTIWDWDWSTVHLLNALRNGSGGSPRLRQNLVDIDFHISCPATSDIENRAWSATLGMKEKDALPYQELGRMIRMDLPLMERLRKALRIKRRSLLQGDYLRQLNQLAKEMP